MLLKNIQFQFEEKTSDKEAKEELIIVKKK